MKGKVKEFVKENWKPILVGTGLTIGGIALYVVSKGKITEYVKADEIPITKRVLDDLAELNKKRHWQAYYERAVGDVTVGDLGKLGDMMIGDFPEDFKSDTKVLKTLVYTEK